ncbi:pilus assembly protein CpaE [Caldalkalibacillus uzonensis]|uniref:Pilus assembly protein CpaE n=1 Tax=Caldalkalibacillus uzonensis TaxID=353224 RepID=A0ABU0CPR1_9BACI|nr:AAA family ATPase [Caldalkalibacillus uzonensis]MDQ0337879.1 pilus assembly protein CpaE [Caldalkalibacillus uzonensis]
MGGLKALVDTREQEVFEAIKTHLAQEAVEVYQAGQAPFNEINKPHFHWYVIDQFSMHESSKQTVPAGSFVIGIVFERQFEKVRELMKYGVDEVLVWPDEMDNLARIITRTKERLEKSDQENFSLGGKGKVISFYSSKGGSGKTFLSSLFAQCLAVEYGKKVMLIDFNVQSGGLEVILGLEPIRTYVDLKPVLSELSIQHIHNIAVNESTTGIDLLLSPVSPERMEELSVELVSKIIRVCRSHYDEVVLDLPCVLDSTSFTALNDSTHIFYVLTPDSLSLRSFKHTLAVFDQYQLNNQGQLSVILNLVHAKQELTERDVGKLVDVPLAGSIRADYFSVQSYLNMGVPFFKKKGHYFKAKPVKDMIKLVKKYEAKVREHVLVTQSGSLAKA